MSYGICYVIIVLSALLYQFSSVLLCQNTPYYNGTLFSASTQYAVKHTVARAKVMWFDLESYLRYIFLS